MTGGKNAFGCSIIIAEIEFLPVRQIYSHFKNGET
jgi:hypothetical protein